MATQTHKALADMLDPNVLMRGFQALLKTVEWAADVARQNGVVTDSYQRERQGGQNQNGNSLWEASDEFLDYEEEMLEDGRLIRRYDDGAVRIENPASGVMQQEGPDGSLMISLPGDKLIYQQYRGEPLLVYDSTGSSQPQVAQVSSVTLPGHEEPAIMFHFSDRNGTHLIELETLRYFRLCGRA